MSAFEVVTACLAGAVFGVITCTVGRWGQIGGGLAFVLGAIGGLLGGAGAHAWLPTGPTWGTMKYHPLELALGAIGGIVVILVVRLVWGPDARPREQRRGTTGTLPKETPP